MEYYKEYGTEKICSFFSKEELIAFRKGISRIIEMEVKGTEYESLLIGIPFEEYPHKGLCEVSKKSKDKVRRIVDKLMASTFFYSFISQDKLLKIAQKYTLADKTEDVCFTDLHIRVDLPSSFKDDEEKFSLPWHQESNYFHKRVAKNSSIVIWIPIYECMKNDGCLEVALSSHNVGILKHKEKYVLPKEKKHLRTYLEEEDVAFFEKEFAEANEGDIYINHFNLIHKSGKNINNNVRYTLLVRASNMNANDFNI